jgi:hypothetical protein
MTLYKTLYSRNRFTRPSSQLFAKVTFVSPVGQRRQATMLGTRDTKVLSFMSIQLDSLTQIYHV